MGDKMLFKQKTRNMEEVRGEWQQGLCCLEKQRNTGVEQAGERQAKHPMKRHANKSTA
jgi:hypothetical protein